ncbi:hypothetical protein [Shewanella algidipiscicola]|uniref:hypothetical protein n=1 Tax=Shewanella algidipiscicola TaxID=614070 RepID=UPI0013C4B5E8|nr:hypothetical protein [Shewanella algidipiscicola]
MPLPNYKDRNSLFMYSIFIFFIFIGPSISLGPLKMYHFSVGVILAVAFFSCLKFMHVAKEELLSFLLLLAFLSVLFIKHLAFDTIDSRYFLYVFYFFVTYFVFTFSRQALHRLGLERVAEIIIFVSYLNFAVAFVELLLGVSIFGLNPLNGDFQNASSLWGNVNSNAICLLFSSVAVYYSGKKGHYFYLTILLIAYCLAIHSKLALMATLGQMCFLLMANSNKARVYFLIFSVIASTIGVVFLSNHLESLIEAVSRAWHFLANTQELKSVVESGSLESIAVRAYALSEMIKIVNDFGLLDFMFGVGFGIINISFYNEVWMKTVSHFPPHFFYMEMLIYSGLSFFIFYFLQFKILSGRFALKYVLILSPSLLSIISVSSAVYFTPYYFFLALIVYLSTVNSKRDFSQA